MKTSCIQHPTQERLLIIREWQVKFCGGNHCAAALLSFYEYWHNIKLESALKNQKSNDIAEMHGDTRTQDESLWQFHNLDELSDGIIGLFGKGTIIKANELLEKLGVISIHKNPNPRYNFDKTNYFEFNAEVCNTWLQEQMLVNHSDFQESTITSPKLNDRSSKIELSKSKNELRYCKTETSNSNFGLRYSKNDLPYCKNGRPIAEITTKISLKKKEKDLLGLGDEFENLNLTHSQNLSEDAKPNPNLASNLSNQKTDVVDAEVGKPDTSALKNFADELVTLGMSIPVRLGDTSDLSDLNTLYQLTQNHPSLLRAAIQKAKQHAKGDFGIRYLFSVAKQFAAENKSAMIDVIEKKKRAIEHDINLYSHEYRMEEEASLSSPMSKNSEFVASCRFRMKMHLEKIKQLEQELQTLSVNP